MENYNDFIIPKMSEYITYIISKIGNSDKSGRTVEYTHYELVNSEFHTLDEITERNLTEAFDMILYFDIFDDKHNIIERQSEHLYVPKMKDNVFYFEGKMRISNYSLSGDSAVRIYSDNMNIGDIKVDFSQTKTGITTLVKVPSPNDEDDDISFDGTPENFEKYKKLLKMDNDIKLRMKIKFDMTTIGDYFTYDMLQMMLKHGEDKYDDSIIDKRIASMGSDFMWYLYRRDTSKSIKINIKKKFWKYGRIYLRDIQNAIDRYFKLAVGELEIPKKVNPFVFDSLKYKIQVDNSVAYNSTFTDLIDIANTPINGNVNKINELNVCSTIDDGVVYYKCYDFKTGKKVTIRYLDYLDKKVLSNDCYDYDTKSIKKGLALYTYKYHLKSHQVNSLDDLMKSGIELVEPSPDEKLSISSRRIPLINMSDSVRVAMGVSMSKQAIEIDKNEPCLVGTGHDEEDINESAQVERFPLNDTATVTAIKDGKIFYKTANHKSTMWTEIKKPEIGENNSVITYTPKVKVGDTLKKGDIMIVPGIMSNGSYNFGVNTFAFYMSYLGYTYEDGIVISESYSKRLTHYSVFETSARIRKDDIVQYLRPIGSKVTSRDILANISMRLRGSRSINDAYNGEGVMAVANISRTKKDLIVPNNIDLGYVVDVHIQSNPDLKNLQSSTNETIKDFISKKEVSEDYKDLPDKYKVIKCLDMDMKPDLDSYIISFKIAKVNPCKVGDKLCDRWGSKGVVSKVIPDDEMPYRDSDNKKAEILLNPGSIVSRKNPSQLYEVALSKVIKEIFKKVKEYIGKNDIKGAKKFTERYYKNRFTEMSDDDFKKLVDEQGELAFNMKVGSYAKITYEEVMNWMRDFNLQEVENVTIPKLGKVENPVLTGDTYMYKLYHAADFKGKVTSTVTDSDAPHMGKGLYRDSGQKIGEMELWALLAYGTEDFAKSDNFNKSQYSFLNDLLLAGYEMQDNNGIPLLSDYDTNLRRLATKWNTSINKR